MAAPLVVWRVSALKHAATAFSGEGAALHPGRWNGRGTRVVYASESLAVAMLEWLSYALNSRLGEPYVYFETHLLPESVLELHPSSLPPDWNALPHPASTQDLGDAWVEGGDSAVLRVPSVVVPRAFNYLLNPGHPDFARVTWSDPQPLSFDSRLERLVEQARRGTA